MRVCVCVCLQSLRQVAPRGRAPLGETANPQQGGEGVFHLPSIPLFLLSHPVPPSWKGSGLPRLSVILKPKDQRRREAEKKRGEIDREIPEE